MKKRIVILGSTGSVGRNVLDVVAHHPERFEVCGLATRNRVSRLREQAATHPGASLVVGDRDARAQFLSQAPELDRRCLNGTGDPLDELISRCEPDLVVNCLVGFVGLKPTLAALSAGVPVALANKEAIVTGGELIRAVQKRTGANLIPIDSEHVAISQCLHGCKPNSLKTIYITASGGALRDRPLEDLATVSLDEVLAHPTWDMGKKITVDSATLVNKGLEVIEAHWLFDVPFDKIKVVVHPQSIVHSLVEFCDNSILAQMGVPDMRLPILYALTHPDRVPTDLARSSITDFPRLDFKEVESERYPCFGLALKAASAGGNMPTVFNSANEVAVEAFLAQKVPFGRIYEMIESALAGAVSSKITCIDDVLETDRRTRSYINESFVV